MLEKENKKDKKNLGQKARKKNMMVIDGANGDGVTPECAGFQRSITLGKRKIPNGSSALDPPM